MKSIKRIMAVLVLVLGSQFSMEASHVAGAEIQYKYIGDSTGIPRQYRVILKVYRDITGIGLGPTATVNITSSCFGNLTLAMTRINPAGSTPHSDGGILTPDLDECVSSSTPGFVTITQHNYFGNVTLPSNCSDIRFYWQTCCRNPAITNLTAPAGDGTYVEAFLNNTNGQNTSPQFITPAAKAFCTNKYFVWSQASIEPNGDSVFYELANAQEFLGGTGVNLVYSAGYSAATPVTTAPGTGGIQVDTKTGTYAFTTGPNQEVCAIVVRAREYRFNNVIGAWEFVGSSVRDMQVVIAGQCKTSVQDGPKIDVSAPGFGSDTISGSWLGNLAGVKISNDSIVDPSSPTGYSYIVPTIAYNCGDSSITMNFDVEIQCTSIAIDGSDFRVIGPDSIARPVIGFDANCGNSFQTDQVRLKLYKPLTVNGVYTVYVKLGNDGNTLLNKCGFPLQEFYTMLVIVDNCWLPNYAVRNVTVDTNWTTRVQYEVDTLSYPKQLTTGVNFFRSDDNGSTWNRVGTKLGMNSVRDPQWTDFSVGPGDVEARNYRYAIQPIVNQEVYNPSANITSIRIDTVFNGNAAVKQLAWNRYNGWLNVNYEVMVSATPEDVNSWVAVSGQGINPTIDTSFSFTLPTDSGCYALRVSGIRLGNPTYVSHSNWEQFCVFEEDSVIIPPVIDEPDSIIVANVFTPNGDLINDLFSVQNIEDYDEASLSVFNRWGNQVYTSTNYINDVWDGTDQNSGGVVADGVYFYVLSIKYYGTQYSEQFQGSVTVFSGGAK